MRGYVALGQAAAANSGLEISIGRIPIEGVIAQDLTLDELRVSRLPDKALRNVQTTFSSQTGSHYQAVHVHENPRGPYILLCGLGKDAVDFKEVATVVAELTGGEPERDRISRRFGMGTIPVQGKEGISVFDRSGDICNVIRLAAKPTQAMVASFTERYAERFQDVKITIAHYGRVPLMAFTNPGFAQTKLSFR